jgi:hypothetical protein
MDLPAGGFKAIARKHDPYWAVELDGTIRDWHVTVTREVKANEYATYTVQGATPEEAEAEAQKWLDENEDRLQWDYDSYGREVGSEAMIEEIELLHAK